MQHHLGSGGVAGFGAKLSATIAPTGTESAERTNFGRLSKQGIHVSVNTMCSDGTWLQGVIDFEVDQGKVTRV